MGHFEILNPQLNDKGILVKSIFVEKSIVWKRSDFENIVRDCATLSLSLSSPVRLSLRLNFSNLIFEKEDKLEKKRMYEAQNFLESQDNSSNFGQDLKSWLSGDANSSPTQSSLAHSSTTTTHNSNVDRVLFKDLVEIVPLVQSLIVSPLSLSLEV